MSGRKVVPGKNTYKEAVKNGKGVVVFTDSMSKGIRVREFNNYFVNGTARFRRFPGSKSKQMLHYITPTLVDDTPEHVILHVGRNNLPTKKESPTKVEEIAQTIVDIGKKCILYGVKTVFISKVITRSAN